MKRFLTILFYGLTFGIVLTLVKFAFHLDDASFKMIVYPIMIALVLGSLIFDLIYTAPLRKKLVRFLNLIEEGKSDEAIPEMEEMLLMEERKGEHKSTQIFRLNLSAAYIETRQFQKAADTLKKIPGKFIKSEFKIAYFLNLCHAEFFLNNKDEFLRHYKENEELFEEAAKNKKYEANVLIIKVLYLAAKGDVKEANHILQNAKIKYQNQRFAKAFTDIEEVIYKNL